jgi:hypothetical protein
MVLCLLADSDYLFALFHIEHSDVGLFPGQAHLLRQPFISPAPGALFPSAPQRIESRMRLPLPVSKLASASLPSGSSVPLWTPTHA